MILANVKAEIMFTIIMFLFFFSTDIDKALSIFNELRKQDPYRIENMDTFSNLLYVRVRLSIF